MELQEEDSKEGGKTSFKDTMDMLLSKEYAPIVVGGCYLCFLSNFLFYGLTYSLPQIFAHLGKELSPAVQVLIISLCDIPGVLLAFFLIYLKSIGHRDGLVMMAGSAAVLAISLISIDHGKKWLFVGLPSAYLVKYVASAFFTLSYVYLSEVFPSKVRASGLSLCIAAGRVGSITSPLIVESLRIKSFKLGEHAPFMILTSALCILAIIMIKLCLHFELKNAPLQDGSASPKRKTKEAKARDFDPEVPPPAG